jgi:hypothetical protein
LVSGRWPDEHLPRSPFQPEENDDGVLFVPESSALGSRIHGVQIGHFPFSLPTRPARNFSPLPLRSPLP